MARLPLREGLPPVLGRISAELQALFGDPLLAYDQFVRLRPRPSFGAKVINDPVWHTVRVEPWEVPVLDSPVVQRLRGIRQLGLAGLVFPTAAYSRFEHSVGALNQTQRFVDAINRNARTSAARRGTPAVDPITASDEVALRLAALLHDIGHGFLSHVSERAMTRLQELPGGHSALDFQRAARDHFRCLKGLPAFAEILSALIVLLPEFARVLSTAGVPGWDIPQLADLLAHLIVGGTKEPSRPFLNELISGAMDADKLDYMPRDCYMAGLPMPVDVERLLEKVRIVTLPARMKEYYPETFHLAPESPVQFLVVESSGGRTVEEMVVSRVLLYEKLYHHQKVRALEGMVANALDLLAAEDPAFRSPATYLKMSDEEFLGGHWPPTNGPESPGRTTARALVANVARRRTVVRAFAFGPSMMDNPDPEHEEGRRAWGALVPRVTRDRNQTTADFRRRLLARTREYLVADGQAGLADELQEHDLVVDLPDVQGIAEKTRFYVGDEFTGIELYTDRFNVERWAEAYENQKSLGYIFGPARHAAAIHVACRDLMSEECGITFDNRSISLTKLHPDDLKRITAAGRRVGHDTRDVEMPAISAVERAAESDLVALYGPVVARLSGRFQTFESHTGDRINEEQIYRWLQQFRRDDVYLAVRVLDSIRYWNRRPLVDALAEGVRLLLGEDAHAQVIPLGGPTTSSHHLNYYWADLQASGGFRGLDLRLAPVAVDPAVPVILYDDNIGLANQSKTVLQQWLGRPRAEWLLDETHVEELGPAALERLRECNVYYLYVTGQRRGLESLIEFTQQELRPVSVRGIVVAPADAGCFEPRANVFDTQEEAARARGVLSEIGAFAFADMVGAWDAEKIASRALGYGNFGGLTVFPYNVPSSTLTCLWKGHQSEGRSWVPLFHRRRRTASGP